jgi:succinylglutamic semialdehyde dehydrogenase
MSSNKWRDFSFSGNYINGRFVIPDHPSFEIEKLNPADLDEHIIDVPVYFPHAEEAVDKARKSFDSWTNLPNQKRLNLLKKLKHSIEMMSPWLVELISRELGRPIWDAKQEIELALNDMNVLFEEFGTFESVSEQSVLTDDKVVEIFKSTGVVAVIAPFNQPVLYPVRSIMSALLLGNTVVYKPSEFSPLVGQVLAEAVHDTGFPNGVFNMVQGEKEVAKRIMRDSMVDTVFFNGTFETAAKVSRNIVDDYWKTLVMGTGGKNASVVMPDCDLDTAICELVFGVFVSTGQRSNGIRRIFVHSDIADEFIEKFHNKSKKLIVGHPLDEYKKMKPFMGPLISGNSMQNYLRLQGIAQREGAETLMRAKELEVSGKYKGFYVTPSIHITDELDEKGVYNRSEIFGPNVAIKRFNNLDQLIKSHNSCDYGYGLSIYSNNQDFIEELVKSSDVGQVFINTITLGESVRYPISGYGQSGNSRPEGSYNALYLKKPVVIYKREAVEFSTKISSCVNIKDL